MEVTLGSYVLEVATGFGPRVTGLRREDSPQLFASLGPDATLEHAGSVFHFRGGHRLWAAPEVPAVSYAPDDHECMVTTTSGGIRVAAPADAAGIVKEIELSAEGEEIVVEHRLTAAPSSAISAAPWAITQVPPGGTAILPMVGADTTPLPDRQLVFWPYTDPSDTRLRLRGEVVVVSAEGDGEMKIGTGPNSGKVGYLFRGWLFVKTLERSGGGDVPDFGAVRQVFVGKSFCELESVGGVETIGPDTSAVLVERWHAVECLDIEEAIHLVERGPE